MANDTYSQMAVRHSRFRYQRDVYHCTSTSLPRASFDWLPPNLTRRAITLLCWLSPNQPAAMATKG
jgi:hypothetical protein